MAETNNNTYGKRSLRQDERAKGRSVKPLLRLVPFVARYKARVVAAFVALSVAAAVTLAVPIALRRVIDFGFSGENLKMINLYFAVMILVVAALAIASSLRFYLVTWIGERVVVDLRTAVFEKLTQLSLSFYETVRTGEVLSRLTADTTQIKSTFGVSASIALRNLFLLVGAVIMMFLTSVKLSGLVLLAIPAIVLPLVLFGRWVRRLSRTAQDTLADSAAMASENINAMSTVQAFTNEHQANREFDDAAEASFVAARSRTLARAILTAAIIFVASGSVVGVLWYGAQSVLSGQMTGGTLTQFVLYAMFAAGAMSALSQVWGEVQLAAGAAERLAELLETEPEIEVPESPVRVPEKLDGAIEFHNVSFTYPTRPDARALHNFSFQVNPGEKVAKYLVFEFHAHKSLF